MSRRKEPAIPADLLDQLLAGTDTATALDQGGLLDTLKKALAERALNAEMDYHLGGDEQAGNSRNGYGRKTVMTDTGKIAIDVPRDRQASFDPQLIAKYQRRFGRTKGGLNSKLHAVCDGKGRPLIMLLSEGQMSDYKGAALMIDAFPRAQALLADRGYDADWFRHALAERGINACIPSKTNRKVHIPHDAALYRKRHKVENMFGKLKDWRRIHTRYDRCAHTFMSAICIAATVIFWLPQ
jgi:transposase